MGASAVGPVAVLPGARQAMRTQAKHPGEAVSSELGLVPV